MTQKGWRARRICSPGPRKGEGKGGRRDFAWRSAFIRYKRKTKRPLDPQGPRGTTSVGDSW